MVEVSYQYDGETLFRQMPAIQPRQPDPPAPPPAPPPPRPRPGADGDGDVPRPPLAPTPPAPPAGPEGRGTCGSSSSDGRAPSGSSAHSASHGGSMSLRSNSSDVNNLWVKYALQYVSSRFEDKRKCIFSLGPTLSVSSFDMFSATLTDMLAPLPLDLAGDCDFDFQKPSKFMDASLSGREDKVSDLVVFSTVKEHADRARLPAYAPKLSGGETIVIAKRAVAHVDRAAKSVDVALESLDGSSIDEFHVLTLAMLTMEDLDTLCV